MNVARIGDIIAIHFFFFLILYFLRKEERTLEENIYLLFVIGAFIADLFFVFGNLYH
jgi:hypothetical protein